MKWLTQNQKARMIALLKQRIEFEKQFKDKMENVK